MRILVTGGAGFIGSQIVDAYLADHHEVTLIDDFSVGKKSHVNSRAQLVTMDVRDPNLSTLFTKNKFEIVNHLAAQIDVRHSIQDPFTDASINILGTLRLLECCRAYGVRKFIFSASGGTYYGECKKQPATEEDPPCPESPYGFSKATAETYIRFYSSAYHLPYTILRYSNVYGPRQDPHGEAGVVAIFIGRLMDKKPVTIYGTGQQERDYVYVGDVVTANTAALTRGENGTFNVSTGTATSVNTLYKELGAIDRSTLEPAFAPARAGELERSVLDPALAGKRLGWHPAHTLRQGLDETYAYFHKSHSTKSSALRKN